MLSFRLILPTALLAAALAAGPASEPAAQQLHPIKMMGTAPSTVWQYDPACGGRSDYPDVPARPFLVGEVANPTVLWFASNSNGSFASVGTGGPDILASLQRGTQAGPGCVAWNPVPPAYLGSTPQSYNTGLWMVAPFTSDGINIQALVHNEFHGDWTGNNTWCLPPAGAPPVYLPCNYWNMVSASSTDGARTFQFAKQPGNPAYNLPAIALGAPYTDPTQGPQPNPNFLGPQGMAAQSNILQIGSYLYVLAQSLPYDPSQQFSSAGGVCIYRAAVPAAPGDALVWTGWDGKAYDVAVPTAYPATTATPCKRVLGSQFRFSWSISMPLWGFGMVIAIIGQDTTAGMKGQNPKVSTDNCPYAPGATAGTTDGAFVYTLASVDQTGMFTPFWPETCLMQINSIAYWQKNMGVVGHAYPSLLDPGSPAIGFGDRNFQYSSALPYLYFTRLNPRSGPGPYNNRDLVRMRMQVGWQNR